MRAHTPEGSKARALLDAALALTERGPQAARAALASSRVASDRELAYWAAAFDYRAGNFTAARDELRALLAAPDLALRGRIYDHYSSVLLYLDEPDEALRVGTLYRDAFPGEADAVGVYATTLAAAGRHAAAIAAAEEAVRLSEGEDTLAGLAKVHAFAGDRAKARELYQRSLERAGPHRRPIRRAALGLLQWIDGDAAAARATVAPCLDGGADADVRERGACLFVAGVVDPELAEAAAAQLDRLAAEATAASPRTARPRRSPRPCARASGSSAGGATSRRSRRPPRRPRRRIAPRSSTRTARRPTSTPRTTCRSTRPGPRASTPRCSPRPATAPAPPPCSARSRSARRTARG